MVSEPKMPEWLRHWHPHPWTKPDKFTKYPGHYQAVWYSNAGRHDWRDERDSESNSAVSVELSEEEFSFTDYRHIQEWHTDDYDVVEHGDFWRMQMVDFTPDQVKRLIVTRVQELRREQQEAWGSHTEPEFLDTPANRVRLPRKPIEVAMWVASLGTAMAGYGSHLVVEDETGSLP